MSIANMSLAALGQSREVEVYDLRLDEIKSAFDEITQAREETGDTSTYRAKMAAGGGKSFTITAGNDDNEISVQSFMGVIIHNHKCNALFSEETQGNTPPICASKDGKKGIIAETGEARQCDTCRLNEYGTAANGRGKACKNMHRLYILTDESPIPIVLTLPPTSLRAYGNYRTMELATRKLKPKEVVTEFSLTASTNSGSQKYSVARFRLAGKLSDDMKLTAEYIAAMFEPKKEVEADDYNRGVNPEQTGKGVVVETSVVE